MTQHTVKSCIRNFWINVINKHSISMLNQNILKLTTRLLAIFDSTAGPYAGIFRGGFVDSRSSYGRGFGGRLRPPEALGYLEQNPEI